MVNISLKRSAPWPLDFVKGVSKAVRAENVRFLGGVFDCPSQQAAELGRSCGALEPGPFAQVFKDLALGKCVFHTAFLFVIGNANCHKAESLDAPAKPLWLSESGVGETSALVRCTREIGDMPKWRHDAANYGEDLPPLGNVKQAAMDRTRWRPWIHQLLLFVGASRQGQGARKRWRR